MKIGKFKTLLLNCFLAAASFISLVPIILMLLNSFKSGTELSFNSWKWPINFVIDNYQRLLSYNSGILMRTYFNSIFVSTTYTILTIIISAMAAFAISKYKFRGKNIIFMLLLVTMMIPGEITIPSLYIIFSRIKWLNTYYVQIFPGIANVFCMFMLKQYMDNLPNSLIEAATIDGAGHTRIFSQIILPLSSPAIGAMAILTFLGKWNDYLWPKIMLTKPEIMPIMQILPTLNDKDSVWAIPWELLMAGCSLVVIPIIIVFFMFQEQFMSSVTIGAVKE